MGSDREVIALMKDSLILGKTLQQWMETHPLLEQLMATEEVFWTNPQYRTFHEANSTISIGETDVREAEERLHRFAPYLAKVFPETRERQGLIESPLVAIRHMQEELEKRFGQNIAGNLLLKCDSHLAISGSIKARGGIYEVLKHTEDLAIANGWLSLDDDYSILDSNEFKALFSDYSIVVGSTGNLGLSIGIMGAQIGFNVTVHMSADAREWKKDLLRSKGVHVVEHPSDYSKAVEEGRKQAEKEPNSYFIDDENSINLFLGYSVAASRLKKQLDDMAIVVDENRPLFVYLPCGVGGGPGGVAFGLKLAFKDNVHCFFAEPTHSPSMLIGLMTGQHDRISVQDFGIDNRTDADGLAVGRPSGFVGKTMEPLISGVYTVEDDRMYLLLSALLDLENIRLEPSALASVWGPVQLLTSQAGQKYIEENGNRLENATHICWATGGSMVPEEVMAAYYQKGLQLAKP
jgi:D-serine dehydratase